MESIVFLILRRMRQPLLTLIVVPTVYMLIAKNTHSPEYISQLIDKLASSPRNRQATET